MMIDIGTKLLLGLIAGALCVIAYNGTQRREIFVSDTCGRTERDACWVQSYEKRPLPVAISNDYPVRVSAEIDGRVKIDDNWPISVVISPTGAPRR